MAILQIEHPVRDYEAWKAVFDANEPRRQAGQVRGYHIYRPIDDTAFVAMDLEFDSRDDAEAFERGLQGLWRTSGAERVLGGAPRSRVVEAVDERTY